MSKALNFDTGLIDYEVNGSAHIRFNPTDVSFVEKFYNTFDQLDDRQEEFQQRIEEVQGDKEQFFAYAHERDEEMRGMVDGLFGEGVADAIFPDMSSYALADGMPLWINFFFAVAVEIRDAFDEEGRKADPRMRQFDAKHQELLAKYKKATTKK